MSKDDVGLGMVSMLVPGTLRIGRWNVNKDDVCLGVVSRLTPGSKKTVDLLLQRREKGISTYGEPLRVDVDRDPIKDYVEEIADAIVYAERIRLLHKEKPISIIAIRHQRQLVGLLEEILNYKWED